MEYNTQKNKLIIAEYGRNLQQMAMDCANIEDREKRTRIAEFIVNVMAQMNPKVKESGEYKQKLWDHLYIMSDFKLDVDSPYPPPSREVLLFAHKSIKYQQSNIRYRHYGKNIEMIIDKAVTYDEGPEKEALIKTIANHLKKSYLNWNRNSVDDEVILKNLGELSGNRLKLSEEHKLSHTNEILARNIVKKKKFVKPGTGNQFGAPGNQGQPYHKLKKKQG
ncbi:MAG TPA: DUF4290 domain-containing protein [Bacteroidales bacterium]|jgi:hypothetical protein|nr:DUF4290 domain-containing protein [Bacteroidales bacterium]MDX9905733.1 DUF4290 domain-containing protein [Bacteroidales bacterium]HOX76461.1 DUF4290 domain-containing protein [Bacteroidales bacterium]HPI85268.1 DUF4290 domain-containing protein [Bacteroidales bacterium]HPM92639.1 DUF4290 domain-containing protein [Bacteroidales bacterium]